MPTKIHNLPQIKSRKKLDIGKNQKTKYHTIKTEQGTRRNNYET